MYRALTAVALLGTLLSAVGPIGSLGHAQALSCTKTLSPDQSIQAAVEDARRGDVICLEPGTWEESVTIRQTLTLRGMGSERSTIRATQDESGAMQPVVLVRGEATREVRLIALENLNLVGSRADGIRVMGGPFGGRATVVATDIRSAENATGIRVIGENVHAMVQQSEIVNNADSGIDALSGAQLEVLSTEVRNNGAWGVQPTGDVSLTNTIVRDHDSAGILATQNAQLDMTDSVIVHNGRTSGSFDRGGIVLGFNPRMASFAAPASAQIERSRIANNHRGVLLGTETDLTLINATVQGNLNWGLTGIADPCFSKVQLSDIPRLNGDISFEARNTIAGNNASGELDGQGNPGEHPFHHLPDGQVCLPH